MYTVNQIFSTALRPFSGVSRNSFLSPNGIIADAVRSVSNNVTIVESKRVVPLLPALYTGDNLYAAPDDADAITGFYPYDGRENTVINRSSPLTIGRDTHNFRSDYALEYRNGVKMLRVQPGAILDTPIMVNQCDSLTADGTAAASGDAANLNVNSIFYLNGTAAIDFDIVPSGGSATISFTDMIAKDISAITRDGVFSLGIFVPAGLESKVISLTLRIGNDDANYYQMTTTKTAYGSSFIHGFNIARFERRGATTVGSVDETAIDYVTLTVTHALTETVVGVKLDAIAAHKGIGYQLEYYSNHYFMDKTTGAFKAEPTDGGLLDKVNVGKEAYELVVLEAEKIMDQNLRGEKSGRVYQNAERELMGVWGDFSNPGLYEQYRLRHPSERRSVITQYTN